MKHTYKYALIVVMAITVACQRRSLDDACPTAEVQIPVAIDWSQSGITPGARSESDYVHRVSIRLFPKDGSPAFDRYLEKNIHSGTITVPEGSYSVVVYNEAIDDPYWNESILFSEVDNYDRFAASIVRVNPQSFDFYTPQDDERFVVEPLKLASWNLDSFEVTPEMRNCVPCREDPDAPINALTKVVLRRLTTPVLVVAEVSNLRSAMRMEGAVSGLSHKVYLRSAQTEPERATHLYAFPSPIWNDASQTDGRVEHRFLSFGRQPVESSYSLNLGVLFTTGERYHPSDPLFYDVTSQVAPADKDIEIRVRLTLPDIQDGIHIGDWNDEEIIIR